VKNRFSLGDKLELVLPQGNVEFTLDKLLNHDGQPIDVAPGSGHQVKLPYSAERIPEKGLLARYV
jgi:putative protease